MPYTLTIGWLWFAGAFVIGLVTGVLVRTVSQRHRPRRPSPSTGVTPTAEDTVDELLARIAELESAEAERDALRDELQALRRGGAGYASRTTPPGSGAGGGGLAPPRSGAVAPDGPPPDVARPDVTAGSAVLGRPLVLDDLTVVEGIEPHVAMLCRWIGIHTWWDLSTTEVSLLRTMLADAGSRFADVDPSTWPEQGRLLAAGRWEEFAQLAESVRTGGMRGAT
jgi:hypothetical protein